MIDRDSIGNDSVQGKAGKVPVDPPYEHPQGHLRERIKELRCLYDVLSIVSDKQADIETTCARVVEVLMRSYLHQDRTVVRIRLQDVEVHSANWAQPDTAIEEPIHCAGAQIGSLCVGYLLADGEAVQFLPEEFELTAAVAAHLAKSAEDLLLLERIRQAEWSKAIGQMTGGLAHDFNNLLTVIIGSAEALRDNLAPDDANLDHAALIAAAAERGSAITAQLLAYSRRQLLSPRTIATAPLLWDMESPLEHTLGTGISLEIDVPDNIWSLHADRTQLENALLNLAVNAREAMPDGGLFRVAVANMRIPEDEPGSDGISAGEYVCIEVSDSGPGMTEEVAKRAFDPFFTTREGRDGLGLSSVIGFVRQSRGRIALTSAVGRGSTFTLCLPRSRGAPAGSASEGAPSAGQGAGERILLVEDEELIRRLATNILTKLGYAVTPAASAEEAQVLLAGPAGFDLLFSDVTLAAGASGVDLAASAVAAHPSLGVLLTSGFTEGATDRANFPFTFIGKPYRRADLAEKVVEALRQRLPNDAPK